MRSTLLKGSCITESDIEVVKVGAYNLPKEVIRDKNEVSGKYTTADMYRGEYLLPERLTSDVNTATDILGSLEGNKKAISISIGSFALGLSGKLETGDIISVIVYDSKERTTFTPPELSYIRVITSTTSSGVDKVDTLKDKTIAKIDFGGSFDLDNGWSGFAELSHAFGDDYENTSFNVGVKYSW